MSNTAAAEAAFRLEIANFQELFIIPTRDFIQAQSEQSIPESAAGLSWKNAVNLPQHCDLLVSTDAAADFSPTIQAHLAPIASHLKVEDPHHRSALALAQNPDYYRTLQAKLNPALPVRIGYTVYSEGIRALAARLRADGYQLIDLPEISPGRIRYLNTKIGGAEFLRTAITDQSLLVPGMVCADADECAFALQKRDDKDYFIVKWNTGAGGSGVFRLHGNQSNIPQLVRARARNDSQSQNSKWPLIDKELFLLETEVGDLQKNDSFTADYFVFSDGKTNTVGFARQLLAAGVQYRGIQWSPEYRFKSKLISIIENCGEQLGEHLFREGFLGYFNLDFIETPDNEYYLCELNIRKSAPLDQFQLRSRLFAESEAKHMLFLENFSAEALATRRFQQSCDEQQAWFDGCQGILPVLQNQGSGARAPYPIYAWADSRSELERYQDLLSAHYDWN